MGVQQQPLSLPALSTISPSLLFTTLWKAAVLVSFRCTKLWFSHRGSICHLTFELERDSSAAEHRVRLDLVQFKKAVLEKAEQAPCNGRARAALLG